MTNKEKLYKAYADEKALGYKYHQIAMFLKEKHINYNTMLMSDSLTDELISRLPEYRTTDEFVYNGTGHTSLRSTTADEKEAFYKSIEWRELKDAVWMNMPEPHICPYCNKEILFSDFWTVHHKFDLTDDINIYKTDSDYSHYTILHSECHRICHEILRTTTDLNEINSLSFMGRRWLVRTANKILK